MPAAVGFLLCGSGGVGVDLRGPLDVVGGSVFLLPGCGLEACRRRHSRAVCLFLDIMTVKHNGFETTLSDVSDASS